MESVFPYFILDQNNKLCISLTNEELISIYNFTSSDITKLNNLLIFQENSIEQDNNAPQTYVHVSDWKVYFDYNDVVSYLFAAAQIGPAAIMAAFAAVGSIYPGVGTVIGAAIGLFGGSALCYIVLQAVSLKKGIYIGIDWNGPFPNPALGLW